jgi:predicted CXXCH cytochrome family protein
LDHFNQGYGLWNGNCIFCHNTRPNPGMKYPDWRFDSEVAETGIACEECHAPGALHARLNRNPLRRYLQRYSGAADGTIVDPARLNAERATQVCGQCHGQRLPQPRDRIVELMTRGDPYTPGQDLATYYEPLQARVKLDGKEHLRFWPDGSPRLTAYEYQGLRASACFTQSRELTCMSCHNMHGGDPAGMIDAAMRTDLACTGCHVEYGKAEAAQKHSGHEAGSASCYDCHMPKVVYGVMSLHPSHLIRSPDPTRTTRHNMPNACNNCHLDRGVNWAIDAANRMWQRDLAVGSGSFDTAEMVRGMATGDVVYRTTLLAHLADSPHPDREPGLLLAALEDPFYIVDHFARRILERRHPDAIGRDWAGFLRARGYRLPEDFQVLRGQRVTDPPFEFGE